MSEAKKKGGKKEEGSNPVDLAAEDPAIIQLYANQIPMYQTALEAAKAGLEARDERISELEGLVNQTKVDSNLKSGMIEFFKQVDRDYVKAIWDLQEKGRFGETKVKDFDNLKPFNDFYEEFKAQAGDDKSKVTSEMVSALDGYRQVLDLLYESRTHQFEHLFQLEDSRKNLKRMSYMDIIKQVEQVNFAEMRKDSENYKIFKETFPKAFQDMIDRMDLVVNDAEKELEIADLKQQVEGLNHLLENNESEKQPESSPAPAGLEGVYAKLDVIQAQVAVLGNSNSKDSVQNNDIYKAVLDSKASIMEGQLKIREEMLDLKQLYANGQAPQPAQPVQPQPYPVQPEQPVAPQPEGEQPAPVQPQPDTENLDDLLDDEHSNPDAPEGESGNLDELYARVKQDRNEGNYQEAIKNIEILFKSDYHKDKVICELATIKLLQGGDNVKIAEQIFMQIVSAPEAAKISEEVKLVAAHNLGYILELAGNETEAGNYQALTPEEDSRINVIYPVDSLEYCDAA